MHFGTPLSLLTMVIWLSSLADAGRSNTSGTAASSCTASCPPKDSTGVALGTGFGDQSTSGGILSCSYPKPGHADPSATYCEYNTVSRYLSCLRSSRADHSSWNRSPLWASQSTGALRQNDDYGMFTSSVILDPPRAGGAVAFFAFDWGAALLHYDAD